MTEWQPIKTAPKDGTDILACWRKGGTMDVVRFIEGHWLDDDTEQPVISEPSHWMPLPEPPTT